MTDSSDKYYGKYRGTVVNNIDPLKMGRLQVLVPDAGIIVSTWASPCLPWTGLQMGMYVVPPISAGVWVEFEHGDIDHPIWVGCWVGTLADLPTLALASTPGAPLVMIGTITQSTFAISDVPVPPMKAPGILQMSGGSFITVDATGITITAPLINLIGAVNITGVTNINAGALLVT